ncbi:MAG TPA: GntR family transcriptional regulator [Chthoniobacterales bacterium]|jgi:DNA-binding GntR family transcriptional regulator|nr:GntR family transcriptional regulator [Chthoniobacterales bacterium]
MAKTSRFEKHVQRSRTSARGFLTEQIYENLKRDIITGHFRSGDSLTEEQLAQRYSASRTPVRQAAARAQQQGFLRYVPNKGYFVSLMNTRDLDELYQWRMLVEAASAELAAKRTHANTAIENLKRHAFVPFVSGNKAKYARFIQADRAFHVGVARLTHNKFLIRTVEGIRDWVDRILYAAAAIDYSDYGESLAKHEQILKAIENQDWQSAKKLMLEHILESKARAYDLT